MTQVIPKTDSTEWSIDEQQAAQHLAIGYTQAQAAEASGIPLSTLKFKLREPAYRALVKHERANGWSRVDPQLWANLLLALQIQSEAMNGTRPADDPAYREARRFIEVALGYRAAAAERKQKTKLATTTEDE